MQVRECSYRLVFALRGGFSVVNVRFVVRRLGSMSDVLFFRAALGRGLGACPPCSVWTARALSFAKGASPMTENPEWVAIWDELIADFERRRERTVDNDDA